MSKPLSYQSARCVLQYFDSTERFLLKSRCPTIKQFEKSIPLRVKELELKKDGIILDDLEFRLIVQYCTKRTKNGKVISRTSSYSVIIKKEDQRMKSGDRTIAHYTTRIQISKEKAFEKLACILLGGRNTVYVKRMEITKRYPVDIGWPANFEVAVDTLIAKHHTFENVLPIVSDASPLEYLESKFSKLESFDNELVKRAEHLFINYIDKSWYPKLATLRNKATYFFNSLLPKEVIINIVKKWKEEGKEIGTYFNIAHVLYNIEDEEDIMDALKNRFGGINGTKFWHAPSRDIIDPDLVYVPMNTSSRIVIHKGLRLVIGVEAVPK
ncbi:hypothetical protein GCK72_007261 [Caenorhabditis remanei]|uniref:DUF38 domain-containing protein n=1 Tax=Caenorhabditis remanei TaxID=31234 RepID=A0A6A5HNE7_CAERE|nr:hypothetical protein GCK72_007261 [Caenorhabditis remanei]KAF1767302.1 hypothetical protein GCK72_007261 [Caenorhabditis remanei]